KETQEWKVTGEKQACPRSASGGLLPGIQQGDTCYPIHWQAKGTGKDGARNWVYEGPGVDDWLVVRANHGISIIRQRAALSHPMGRHEMNSSGARESKGAVDSWQLPDIAKGSATWGFGSVEAPNQTYTYLCAQATLAKCNYIFGAVGVVMK